ncbi:type VI secretion system baseplate subunit TssF [Salmonella enterica]|uniref:type VI secretion system baseplate subunit TssF n=1 Tax=Salmonella enterica TaxID=28901 RepID=UPI000B283C1E|nr:type VI secretion protein, family [Salmonella enterica subsp. salamae]
MREKIGDDYPELTVPLITRLWPAYLRPVPAITVIEYTPDRSRLTAPVIISRGEQVMNRVQDSQPENARPGEEGTDGPPPCIFTLCRDIRLLPLHTEAIQNRSSLSAGVMDMTFSITGTARLTANDLNGISFWLGSEDECSRY